jgi:hypothetical protein
LSISLRFPDQNKFSFNAILATYQSHLIFDIIVFTLGEYVNFEAPSPFLWPDILHYPTAFSVLSPSSTQFSSILNLCFSLRVRADGSQTYEQLNNGFL